MKIPRLLRMVTVIGVSISGLLAGWLHLSSGQKEFTKQKGGAPTHETGADILSALLDRDKVKLEAILKSGISPNDTLVIPDAIASANHIEEIDSALGLAVLAEDVDSVDLLLKYGASKTHRDPNGLLPIHNSANLSNAAKLSPGFSPNYTTLIEELCSRFKLQNYLANFKTHPFDLCATEFLTRIQLEDCADRNLDQNTRAVLSITIDLDLEHPELKRPFRIALVSSPLGGSSIAGEVWFLHGAWFVDVKTLGNM